MSTPTKLSRVLEALAGGRSFNWFEASRELSDWCLHSTVARPQSYGIRIFRKPETVPGYQGAPTRVMRYQILPDDREQARRVLADLKRSRKKKPTVDVAARAYRDRAEPHEAMSADRVTTAGASVIQNAG